MVYLDDKLDFGTRFKEHRKNFENMVRKFRIAELKLNSKKWFLFWKEVKYLGDLV